MKTTIISTANLWNAPRSNLSKMQAELAKSTREMATGRDADVGLRLGNRTGEAFSARQELAHLQGYVDGNANVLVRLNGANSGLDQIRNSTDKLLSSIISVPSGDRNADVIKMQADGALKALSDDLSRAVSGQYLFGGINSGTRPIEPHAPMSPAAIALEGAFVANFGFGTADPAVATITATDLKTFLDGPFNDLFDDASWGANWSNASDTPISSRISDNEVVDASVSANAKPFRQIAMGLSMLSSLGISQMSQEARGVLVDAATKNLGDGASGVGDLQATLGVSKQRLTDTNERMEAQQVVMTAKLDTLEGVDPLEAKTKIDQLTTQIQTSFALTAQIRGMSLLNFL